MKNLKKWQKRLIVAVCALLIVLSGGLVYVGNFLVDYALVRKGDSPASADDGKTPTHAPYGMEIENKKNEQALYEEWIVNIETETVLMESHDGLALNATYYNSNPGSNKLAILIHGYCANQGDMKTEARRFSLEGYNVLTPDMRSHGKSEGVMIGMGWLDRLDVVDWVEKMVSENNNLEIILYGESMGGATVMMTSGEKLPSNVKAIVEDCGYTSVYDMFVNELKNRFNLPEHPILDAADLVTGIRAGYNFKDASALKQVQKATVPMMFIHGSNDNYVLTDMVYPLYEACPTEKELLIIEGAGHGASADVDPDLYWSSVFAFLTKYL